MSTLSQQRTEAANTYAAALENFVGAYARLAALDLALKAPGFGPAPDTVSFRHAAANPDWSTNFVDRIKAESAALHR